MSSLSLKTLSDKTSKNALSTRWTSFFYFCSVSSKNMRCCSSSALKNAAREFDEPSETFFWPKPKLINKSYLLSRAFILFTTPSTLVLQVLVRTVVELAT